ncbi:MAG TPA: hypothetical protein PKE03_09725 [Bacteroidales bacterium]|nr:hypothetical protein [Bacteroidales bacterium]
MKYILIIIMPLILFQEERSLNELLLEVNICRVEQEAQTSSFIAIQLVGNISLHNMSSDLIVLPKTFDLEIVVWDSDMRVLGRRKEIGSEYHNLIKSQTPIRIKSGEKVEIEFVEWRLFMYELVPGNQYFIQYILPANWLAFKGDASSPDEI